MKHITGNLSDTGYEELIRNFTPGEEDTLDKKLPHVGKSKDIHFLGNCIFTFVFNIPESNTETQIIPDELDSKKVIIDGSLVNLDDSNYTFQETGKHVVQILASDIWTSIGGTFINGWINLKEIEFPSSIEVINFNSIVGCSGLEKLKFGKKLREINGDLSALDLEKIEISKRNKNLRLIDGKYIVSYEHPDTLLGTLDGTISTNPQIKKLGKSIYAGKTLTDFVIPGNIEELGDGSFEGSTFIGSLELGEGIKKIDSKAFYNIDISELDSLIIKPTIPPTVIDPGYFDLRDIDGNGNQISGVEIEDFYLPEVISKEWRSWNQYFAYFSGPRFQYFTLEAVESCAFSIEVGMSFVNPAQNTSLSYSLDDGTTWTTTQFPTSQGANQVITITTPTIQVGGKVLLKGIMRHITVAYSTGGSSTWNENSGHFNFSTNSKKFNISGNILSLFYGDNYLEHETFPNTPVPSNISSLIKDGGNLCCLFKDNVNLYSTADLFLPPKLTEYCCANMFRGCTSLVYPPKELPATLAGYCYQNMFKGCTSLTTVPVLPATTLENGCYANMFSGCTSLTTAPELPATTLAIYCYSGMFQGCTSLTIAPELPATTLADWCYKEMFFNCSVLTILPALPATTLALGCYNGMFGYCTELINVSTNYLPVTTLANDCYSRMFYGCTSLITAPELPATTLANNCYDNMFSSCTSLKVAPELPATTLANNCYWSMFSNCTSLITAPDLPATTLASNCYFYIFNGCTSLKYIKVLCTTNPNSYILNWVKNVPSGGTFVMNPDATWSTTGIVPSGWNVVNEVEYLNRDVWGSGPLIDMGVYGNLNTELGVTYMSTGTESSQAIAGSRGTNNNIMLFTGTGNNDQRFGDLSVKATTTVNVKYTATINKTHYVRSDNIDLALGYNTAFTTDTTLKLFGWNKDNYGIHGRIYSAYVKQDGELIRDLIPVRQGTTGYMCDRVSGQLFRNVGSGNFTLGPDL